MRNFSRIVPVALATVLGLGAISGVVAANHTNDSETEKAEIASAKLAMADAVTAAEKETGGKATETEIVSKDGTAVYAVEILKADGTEQEVMVDAMNGTILNVALEGSDNEGVMEENEEEDEKDE